MALVSIRLNDEQLAKLKTRAQILHLTQTEYIHTAINHMNHEAEKIERSQKLKEASLKVRKESMKINAQFAEIERDIED